MTIPDALADLASTVKLIDDIRGLLVDVAWPGLDGEDQQRLVTARQELNNLGRRLEKTQDRLAGIPEAEQVCEILASLIATERLHPPRELADAYIAWERERMGKTT
jgi:hypothetical protein